MFKPPYDTEKEKTTALERLQEEYEAELAVDEWLDQMGFPHDDPSELKVRQ